VKPSTAATLDLLRWQPAGITALDALDRIGSFRLGARVWELRAAGYDVTSERNYPLTVERCDDVRA